jgi:predicted acetyltransferase
MHNEIMELKLVMPCQQYWDSYLKSFNEMDHAGCVKGMDWDGESDPEVYFQDALDMQEGRNLGDLVPASNFWIIAGEEYVGRMSIRHELNDWLRNFGGHVGYEIKASARRKGYASEALKLALNYCRKEIGVKELLVTCANDNVASIKVIEKNGGKLIESKNDQDGRLSRYYKILL